ncbi:hypothetical protein Tco_0867602 [Tanacetum coccineum]
MDCHAGNPWELPSDLTANNDLPIIEELYGQDQKERGKQVKGLEASVKLKHPIWHLYHLEIRDTSGSGTKLRGTLRISCITMSRGLRRYEVDEGQELFTSDAWRRLFEIRAPLVQEFILKFLSTCRMSDTEMRLDVVDNLCFQLGGARRRMTWRQFILGLGLHTDEEIAKDGFGAYWLGSERVIPDEGALRDYYIEISSNRDFLGSAPSYVFIQDPGTANVPYLLAQYLFRHAKGMHSGARLSKGYFIGRLAAHFGQVSDQGLRGLSVVTREFLLIDLHELGRLNVCERIGDT